MRPHPAKFSDVILETIYPIVKDCKRILDPFAGVGKITHLKDMGYKGEIWCNEIEPEWAQQIENADGVIIDDVLDMSWAPNECVDAIATSPCYGTRMSDHYNAKDNSKRFNYRQCLGRPLHINNAGRLQFGNKYCDFHEDAYEECKRILCNDGLFVLNISDHIRKSKQIAVSAWHCNTLITLGFQLLQAIKVKTPKMRYGQNANKRVSYEWVVVFKKVSQ